MTINRHEHQRLTNTGVKGRAFIQIFEAMFRKILNVFGALLVRTRHLSHKLLVPRRLTNLFSECVVAIMRIARQHKYRDWIGFVEPQQNRAFKLSDCRFLLVGNKDSRARTRLWLFARLPTHWLISASTIFVSPFAIGIVKTIKGIAGETTGHPYIASIFACNFGQRIFASHAVWIASFVPIEPIFQPELVGTQ